MPLLILPEPKEVTYRVELTQSEVNHLRVVLGQTCQSAVEGRCGLAGLQQSQVSNNSILYKFFKELSEGE